LKSESQTALLKKARRSLQAAEALYQRGDFDFAASRAYYAMFYATKAILLENTLAFSSHAAVISAFGKEFVKTGFLNAGLHHYLVKAQILRSSGDYDAISPVSKEQVEEAL